MPKGKTRSGAKKRFRMTATGKIKRSHAYHSHILTSKTKKRKRNLRKSVLLAEADERAVKRMLLH